MQYCKRFLIGCCALLFSAALSAQSSSSSVDITGLWTGYMYNDTTQLNYKYEIAISEKKGKLYGFSHTYFILDNKQYHGVKKIKITREGDKVITQDLELIANNYPVKPPKGVYVLNVLNFELKNSVMVLSGLFTTNRTRQYSPVTGYIHVERKSNFRQSALVPHLEELGLVNDLSFVAEEKKKEAEIAKAEPVAKPLPEVKAKPAEIKETKPAEPVKTETVNKEPEIKKEEVKAVVKTPQVNKPAETKSTPVVTEKPVTQTTAKAKETAVVKTAPVAEQKAATVKKDTVAKTIQAVTAKVVTAEPAKIKPVANAAVDIKNRTIETIQSVNYASDSLVLTLYDNGEVDGDTVSVLLNGEVIMPRVGLTTNAVQKTIYTKDLPETIQIVMYAETLGSLPPNTGLLIVYDGKERYEIRFSGDLKKNAAIEFRKKER